MKERHSIILKTAVETYTETGVPVSSKLILEKNDLGLSSATIRNDLAELEKLGYLEQPHTSAGRIPTEKGYRFYIDNLLQTKDLAPYEEKSISDATNNPKMNADEFLKEALSLFSEITGYTSAAVISHSNTDKIIKLEVIKTNDKQLNLIVVTKSGIVKNSSARVYFLASDEEISDLNKLLEEYLGDVSLAQIDEDSFEMLEKKLSMLQQNWSFVVGMVKNIVSSIINPKVIVSGQAKMLSYPEFYEIHKAKNVMDFLTEEEKIYDIITHNAQDSLRIVVGSEMENDDLSDMGLVVKKYSGSSDVFGALSIFGPKRMDYSKSVSQIEYFAKCIERFLKDNEDDL